MSHEYIEIIGARENNLKDISLKIPKKKITIFTGVSGSGKFIIRLRKLNPALWKVSTQLI